MIGPTTTPRRRWLRSPIGVLVVVLLVGAGLFLAWRVVVFGSLELHFGSGYDKKRFDKLEHRFEQGQEAYARADARMRELAAAHPQAERISWSRPWICVREPGRADDCKPATPEDEATYLALGGVDVIVHQAKDAGRTFFRFYGEEPPRYTIMNAAGDPDPETYADDRGFRSTRSLTPGWTILGPIPEIDLETAQFP